jgi:hypothetical protein
MSKVRAVAATIVFMLGASVAQAQVDRPSQSGQNPFDLANPLPPPCTESATTVVTGLRCEAPQGPGKMYVACWAEVPSHNTAYFTGPFLSPTVNSARKEFRQLVTTQYGPVGKLQCAGKFNQTVVNEQVEKWKDSARSKNAIVDTDWQPVAALSRPLPSAQAKN